MAARRSSVLTSEASPVSAARCTFPSRARWTITAMSAPLMPPMTGRILRWSIGANSGRPAFFSVRARISSRISCCPCRAGRATPTRGSEPPRAGGGAAPLALRGGPPRGRGARLARLRRRQQVLERERLGLVQEEDGLALADRDPEDLLQQLARVRAELGREVRELQVVEDRARRRRQGLGEL